MLCLYTHEEKKIPKILKAQKLIQLHAKVEQLQYSVCSRISFSALKFSSALT